MAELEKVIKGLEMCTSLGRCSSDNCPYYDYDCLDNVSVLCCDRLMADAFALLKEQEDMGKELTDAMELIHKKNERIKKLEEQIETLTKWRMNAGAFD